MTRRITLFSIITLLLFISSITIISAREPFDLLEDLLSKEYLTSAEIIEHADTLDGYTVTLRGEVVSEPLERGDYCWINVYDNENFISIGVITNLEMIKDIEYWGGHRVTGNTIEVKGKVFRADPFADGELDVHADSIKVLKDINAGYRPVDIPLWKIITAVILVLVFLGLFIENTYHFMKKRAESRDSHVLEQYIDDDIS